MTDNERNEAIDVPHTDLAVRENAQAVTWVPSFAVAVDEMVEKVNAKRDFFQRVMREGEHYGKIPGTGPKAKPTLLKPGAELLNSSMGLAVELTDASEPTVDYGEEGREGLIRYRRICRIYKQTGPREGDRMKVAQAEGVCSTKEPKYRYRNSKRLCPECGNTTIIKSKDFNTGKSNGWLCWKKEGKSDGCGAKWPDGAREIESQEQGKSLNLDLGELENTILKMADKRALVAATLLATGTSDIFTQDLEDNQPEEPPSEPVPTDPLEGQQTPPLDEATAKKAADKIRQVRAKINALWTDNRMTPYERNEVMVELMGPLWADKTPAEIDDPNLLLELGKALKAKLDDVTNEVPL